MTYDPQEKKEERKPEEEKEMKVPKPDVSAKGQGTDFVNSGS